MKITDPSGQLCSEGPSERGLDGGGDGLGGGEAAAGGGEGFRMVTETVESFLEALFDGDGSCAAGELVRQEDEGGLVELLVGEVEVHVGGNDGGDLGKAECEEVIGSGLGVMGLAFGEVVEQGAGVDEFQVEGEAALLKGGGETEGGGGDGAGVIEEGLRHGKGCEKGFAFGGGGDVAGGSETAEAGVVFGVVHVEVNGFVGDGEVAGLVLVAGEKSGQVPGRGFGFAKDAGGDERRMAAAACEDGVEDGGGFGVEGGGELADGLRADEGDIDGKDEAGVDGGGESGGAGADGGEHAAVEMRVEDGMGMGGFDEGTQIFGAVAEDDVDFREAGGLKEANGGFERRDAVEGEQGLEGVHAGGVAGGEEDGGKVRGCAGSGRGRGGAGRVSRIGVRRQRCSHAPQGWISTAGGFR